MSMQRLTIWGGDRNFSSGDSALSNGNFYGFTVREDCIVSVATGGDQNDPAATTENYVTYWNVSSVTLLAGETWTVPFGEVIKAFNLSQGKVKLHRIARP